MSALEIRPHSPRISGWVVAGLMVLGAGSFAAGVAHQVAPNGPAPFPPQQFASYRTPAPDATPAPAEQLAAATPAPRKAAPAPDITSELAKRDETPAVPATAQGADAAATVSDAAPPAAEPAHDTAPPAEQAPT